MQAATTIAWAAARESRWQPARSAPRLGLDEAVTGEPHGVCTLLFGVGTAGARLLRRLTRSDWFDGLQPQPEDLAVSFGAAAGRWAVRAAAGPAEAELAMRALPAALVALVMAPQGDGPGERAATLSLVAALRRRRDPRGGKLHVCVTLEGAAMQRDGFAARLAALGAFVLRPGRGVGGLHFHSFPVRAPMFPMLGRLVCHDLADYLHTWRPGRTGVLHTMPATPAAAAPIAARLATSLRRAAAINVSIQRGPMDTLLRLEQLVSLFRQEAGPETDATFGDSDRPDGRTGLMDVAVIHAG